MFETAEEMDLKVTNSVIGYGNEFIYVRGANNMGKKIRYVQLPLDATGVMANQIKGEVNWEHPALNYNVFKLGYCNEERKGRCMYLIRKPVRRMRQGLAADNVYAYDPKYGDYKVDFTNLLYSKGFIDMLKGKYPTPEEALEILKEKVKNKKANGVKHVVAFHRHFAFSTSKLGLILVQYKGEDVAWGKSVKDFNIPSQFMYLKEVFNKVGVNVNELV